jgi:hypothetical protein
VSLRIGVALVRDRIHMVAMQGGVVTWQGEERADADTLVDVLWAMSAQLPRTRWRRPSVHAVIGPHASQLKLLSGLPERGDVDALTAIVRQAVGAFFLKGDAALIVPRVRIQRPGEALASVIEAPLVQALESVSRRRGWRLVHVAPVAAILPQLLEGDVLTWTDGAMTVRIARSGGNLTEVRTRPVGATAPASLESFDKGLDGPALASAATRARFEEDLVHLGATSPKLWSRDGRRPLSVAAAALAVSLVSLGLSPLASVWADRSAERRLTELSEAQMASVKTSLSALAGATAVLERARRFEGTRRFMLPLLAGFADLPDDIIVASVEIAENGGEMTVLAPSIARALQAVGQVSGIVSVVAIGGVGAPSTEMPGRQRVALRFSTASTTPPDPLR